MSKGNDEDSQSQAHINTRSTQPSSSAWFGDGCPLSKLSLDSRGCFWFLPTQEPDQHRGEKIKSKEPSYKEINTCPELGNQQPQQLAHPGLPGLCNPSLRAMNLEGLLSGPFIILPYHVLNLGEHGLPGSGWRQSAPSCPSLAFYTVTLFIACISASQSSFCGRLFFLREGSR